MGSRGGSSCYRPAPAVVQAAGREAGQAVDWEAVLAVAQAVGWVAAKAAAQVEVMGEGLEAVKGEV